MSCEFWYWPMIPGRGEFVRLFMEAAGIEYRDMGRELGPAAVREDMTSRTGFAPFAPPYLVDEQVTIAHVAHIVSYLTDKHSLGPGDLSTDMNMIQLQLTITDFVGEAHDTHHPIANSLYYEDQKDEALRRATPFREERMPKYLNHFEKALAVREGPFMLGEQWCHVDTSLFVLLNGLEYAFPERMKTLCKDLPRLMAMRGGIAALENVKAYRASDRCIPYNDGGLFRHYPELDAP